MAELELECEGCRWRQRQMNGLSRKLDVERTLRQRAEESVQRLCRKLEAQLRRKSARNGQGMLQLFY